MAERDSAKKITRRSFVVAAAQASLGLILPPLVQATPAPRHHLSFCHAHTGERLSFEYTPGGRYNGSIRKALEYFLRDFRTGDIHSIDPLLLDALCNIQECCNNRGIYEVISGFRSHKTNALLRKVSTGVAKKSYHTQGRAIDIRLVGVGTKTLHDIALQEHNGGVGYYPDSDFVHIDTGRKRSW